MVLVLRTGPDRPYHTDHTVLGAICFIVALGAYLGCLVVTKIAK